MNTTTPHFLPSFRYVTAPLSGLLFLTALMASLLLSCSSNGTGVDPNNDQNDRTDRNDGASPCFSEGSFSCLDSTTTQQCLQKSWRKISCPPNTICDPSDGACVETICKPGEYDGCTKIGGKRRCNTTGTKWINEPCGASRTCYAGACEEADCTAGSTRCLNLNTIQECDAKGKWQPGRTCIFGHECVRGECKDLCDFDQKISSYVGCEYWSADLPNYDDAISLPHAVVVSNINSSLAATITFYEGASDTKITLDPTNKPYKTTLQPKEIGVYSFPNRYDHSGTRLLTNKSIRLKSNIPVIAYQYNPLHNTDLVYSNDGTVLLPTNAVGTEYYVTSWTHRSPANIRGFVTIINSTENVANVRITPSAEITPGNGIAAMLPGVERTFSLQPGQSLNLETAGSETEAAKQSGCLAKPGAIPDSTSPCPDLTGTHIVSDQKITVFGGHQCANVLLGVDRCDHVESILLPVSSWGTDYLGTKFFPRAQEPDIFRVIAAEDNTSILTDPAISHAHNRVLNKGEWLEFEASQHFLLKASKPVMITQFMVGSNWIGINRECSNYPHDPNPTGIGDPSMALVVPTNQWRTNYQVLTPDNYKHDFLNVAAPANAVIKLNGKLIPESRWAFVGTNKAFKVGVIAVKPGTHHLTSSSKFAVTSYGYHCHVSYATPGGMNVEALYSHE